MIMLNESKSTRYIFTNFGLLLKTHTHTHNSTSSLKFRFINILLFFK